ncbi:hypothetical protein G3N55_03955 [Dissulfurirhabdus thermomarina]|uniref:DUF5666 domain-containing protein n=1 Tax=Dissulfurirhabdus thermomarina TaxID=1765737 RepID=A0A6N9TQL0_DISTH|nr:hypothetical protein [Dissulfurirhabdus thermomarina]NDY42004.1 hypothetical protein [Dissulfurirhabdus thermomarina]NMX24011.1 hypothetical protein [Dissulfurirhabdus thermomarina]
MQKKILSLVLSLVFALGVAGVAIAKKCKGKVTAVEGNTLVIDSAKCGEMKVEVKKAKEFEVGDEVTVKNGKVKKARKKIEGC